MQNINYDEKIFKLINDKGELNYGLVYIVKPKTVSKKLPLLIALHGSGREALSYRDIPFYSRQRDIALECGYIFACISNASHTFGTDTGYKNNIMLLKYIKENYNTHDKFVLWASSAGGLMMHRLIREFREEIDLLLGTFPIFNPYTTKKIPSLLKAFGVNSEDEFIEATGFLSPDEYPKDIYKDIKIVIAHGIDDTTVEISQSEEFLNQVEKHGGDMELIKAPGGHSVDNFELYMTDAFHKALRKRLI